jgi:hypothetical protein
VRAPAGASVIHPALMPWFRPPGPRQREVWAVLDTLAARWLAERGVPLEVSISYVAEDRGRVFDSVLGRLGAARDRLKGDAGRPAAAARMVVTAMYQHTLGGWLASDAWDRAGDWLHAPDWWLTIKTQAEVRKQRALLPSVSSGALVVLRSEAIDTVLLAAPSLEALEAAQTSGGRRLVREAAGGFRIERTAEVTPGLAADLSSAAVKTRRAALEAAFPQSDTGKE